MNTPDAIIERIRKILARTTETGCTEAEADAALALASRLATQHNIDMATVAADAPLWIEEGAYASGQIRISVAMAAKITEDYFFVKGYQTPKHDAEGNRIQVIMFFGKSSNVATAKFVFNCLVAAMDRLWVEYRARTGCPLTLRKTYVLGLTRGFRDKMDAERAAMIVEDTGTGTALAIRNINLEIRSAFDDNHSSMKFRGGKVNAGRGFCRDTFEAGREAGGKINLSRPLDAPAGARAIEAK